MPPLPLATLRAALDQVHEGVLVVDIEGIVMDANRAAWSLLSTEPVGRPTHELLEDVDRDLDVEVHPLDGGHNAIVLRPVPVERIALTSILEQMPASVIRLDPQLFIVNVSNLWLLATGLTREAVVGTHLHDLPLSDRLRDELVPLVEGVLQTGRRGRAELLVMTTIGLRWAEFAFVVERDRAGTVTHVIGVSTDVTHRKNKELSLSREAATDSLTGVLNRSGLNAELRRRIEQPGWTGTTLLVIDLDGFKQINDEHGHLAGDDVLIEVARRLRTAVADDRPVARLGGDEFVVLDGRSADATDGAGLADAIQRAFTTPVINDTRSFDVRLSIGVATVHSPDDGLADVFNRADEAMYRAKRTGVGTVVDRA